MLVVNDLKDLGGSLGSISVLGGTQFPPSYFSYSSAYTWQKGGFLGINIQGCQKLFHLFLVCRLIVDIDEIFE